jgi:transcriptional regulator with XRE-family HTH domain
VSTPNLAFFCTFCLNFCVSEFSTLLSDAMTAAGLTQAEVEKRTGIDRTVLSRLMAGVIAPSSSNLTALLRKFQPGTMVGHELVIAHLRDEAAAAGLDPATLSIRVSTQPDVRDSLPASLVADLDLLAVEAAANPDYADLVNDWAAVIRGHRRALEGKIYPFSKADGDPLVADPKAPASKRRPRSATTLPRGDSQAPAG